MTLAETKTSMFCQEIGGFQRIVKRAAGLENIPLNDVCQVIVVHDVTPKVEEYVREQGIHLYWSYDL